MTDLSDEGPRNTGWAIVVAVLMSAVFFAIYWALFSFVVAAYASYDATFATGFGALIFLVVGPNVLGVSSGVAVTKTLFKRASRDGIFYGVATYLVVFGVLHVIGELGRPDGSWAPIVSGTVITAICILAARIILNDAKLEK